MQDRIDSVSSGDTASRPIAAFAAATAILAVIFLLVRDPRNSFLPECSFRVVTGGLLCPGCGGTRMLYSLLHGRIGEAFTMNPLAFLATPFLTWFFLDRGVYAVRGRRLPTLPVTGRLSVPILIVVVAFWLLRNLVSGLGPPH